MPAAGMYIRLHENYEWRYMNEMQVEFSLGEIDNVVCDNSFNSPFKTILLLNYQISGVSPSKKDVTKAGAK